MDTLRDLRLLESGFAPDCHFGRNRRVQVAGQAVVAGWRNWALSQKAAVATVWEWTIEG
jgi:hypothetical protein